MSGPSCNKAQRSGWGLVAIGEENKDFTGEKKDHVLGQDEKTHVFCVFTIQLHTNALPTVTKSKTEKLIS